MFNLEEINKLHQNTYNNLADSYNKKYKFLYTETIYNINNLLKFTNNQNSVLDLGCGIGIASEIFLEKNYKVTSIDISNKMLSYCKNPNKICADYLEQNFDNKFDIIYIQAFIHLFPYEIACLYLEKVYKDLNNEGLIMIGTSYETQQSEGFEYKKDYNNKDIRYRKRWTENNFIKFIKKHNFKILNKDIHTDQLNKTWIDIIAAKL